MGTRGLIFDMKRFSVNDGPGIRTTVFFKGCPLFCQWCHNPESRVFAPEPVQVTERLDDRVYCHTEEIGRWMTTEEVMSELEKELVFYETSGGGVTFSGGEPLLQPEFLADLAGACKRAGLHTALDTSGCCDPKVFQEVVREVDLVLFDLKILEPGKHEQWTGSSNEEIHRNLQILDESGKSYVVRIPLIPGVNDTPADIGALIRYLKTLVFGSREVHLLPYHRMGSHKLKRLGLEDPMGDWPEPRPEAVRETVHVLENEGFTVKTGG